MHATLGATGEVFKDFHPQKDQARKAEWRRCMPSALPTLSLCGGRAQTRVLVSPAS